MPRLTPGEPAPWFTVRSPVNEHFRFDTVAGRYVVLMFFGSAGDSTTRVALELLQEEIPQFDEASFLFFGVSRDSNDERLKRIQQCAPGLRLFWDFDCKVSELYGAVPDVQQVASGPLFTVVLDERLRTLKVFTDADHPAGHVSQLVNFLVTLPKIGPANAAGPPAPVLVVPRVFEPELCRKLIELYNVHGGTESGFMRDRNGMTIGVIDYGHKRRKDYVITDENVRRVTMARIHDRLVPEIRKAFQFAATRMERYIVACYDGETGGHFRAHRDNTTKGTAHRKFAVSLNLNTGEYEGGQLRLPEFGPQLYAAPAGGAVVFSCSLLHQAEPVTRGHRYAFLPFLYDDEAARLREQNQRFLVPGISPLQKHQFFPGGN